MTIRRLKLTVPKLLLAAAMPALALAAYMTVGQAANTHAAPQQAPAIGSKATNTSVLRTSEPTKARAAIKSHGLRAQKTIQLPDGDTLLVINTVATSDSAKAIKRQMKADRDFTLTTNYQYKPTSMPNDPLLADGSQWNIPKINAPQAWDVTTGSSNTTIAVIDSGVLSSQSWVNSSECTAANPCAQADFPAEKIWTNVTETGLTTEEGPVPNCTSRGIALDKSCNNIDDDANGFVDDNHGWDFMGGWRGNGDVCPNYTDGSLYNDPNYPGYVAQDNDPQPYSCDSPNYPNELNKHHYSGSCTMFESACYTNHGTAAASAATSATNNGAITAGVDWNAKVMPLRAMDAYGWTDSAHITAAVEYATAMNADVISLSLAVFNGGSCTPTDALLEPSLKKAFDADLVVVGAAGNGGSEGVCYPANSQYAIAVGASDKSDNRASFSTYGPELDVVAPGLELALAIAPSKSSNNYRDYSLTAYGTSFSTPQVAGLASLIIGVDPTLSAKDVREVIRRSATKVPGMNGSQFTNEYGYGRIDAHKAVTMDYSTLATPQYVTFETPRDMKVTSPVQKTDLLTSQLTGPTISRNTILSMGSETYINGVRYIRTQEDTLAGNHLGIQESYLRESTTTKNSPRR